MCICQATLPSNIKQMALGGERNYLHKVFQINTFDHVHQAVVSSEHIAGTAGEGCNGSCGVVPCSLSGKVPHCQNSPTNTKICTIGILLPLHAALGTVKVLNI